MPTLKNPYSKTSGAVHGLATGLNDFMGVMLKHRLEKQRQDEENKAVTLRQQGLKNQEEFIKASDSVRTGATEASDYPDFPKPFQNQLALIPGKSQAERLGGVVPKIGQDTTDSQIQALLDSARVKTDPGPGGMFPSGPTPTEGSPDNLPSTAIGPTAMPGYQAALQARNEAGVAGDTAFQRKLAQGADTAYQDTYQRKSAEAQSALEHGDEVANQLGHNAFATTYGTENAKTQPEFVDSRVDEAGRTTGAQEDAKMDPTRVAARVGEAGQKAGTEAAAKFPWEAKLAQTRADTTLLNAKALDDYRKAHPAATADQLNRAHKAMTANSMIDTEIHPLLDEMQKRDMLGMISSRFDELMTNKIKTSELFKTPEDAQLAARFMDDAKLLSSLVANVHAGQRGAAGAESMKYFKQIFNGIGDINIQKGQLGSIHKLMDLYANDPNAPDNFPIDGFNFSAPGTQAPPDARFMGRR